MELGGVISDLSLTTPDPEALICKGPLVLLGALGCTPDYMEICCDS